MNIARILREHRAFVLLAILGLVNSALPAAPTLSFSAVDSEPLCYVSPTAMVLHDNWKMKEEALVGNHGASFSMPGFKTVNWYSTTVPTTALGTLVRNGVYPDPYIGTNRMRIPDVSDVENKRYGLLKCIHQQPIHGARVGKAHHAD